MCGIGGIVLESPGHALTDKVVKALAWHLRSRGLDAGGIYTAYFNDFYIFKKPGDIAQNFKYPPKYGRLTLVHTRAATHGDPSDNNNNHPLVGSRYVLIHNGVCSLTPRISDYPYRGQCDSELILAWVERRGLNGLREIRGRAGIAFCEKVNPSYLYLFSWESPICLAYLNGFGYIFASTQEILEKVIISFWGKYKGLFPPAFFYNFKNGDLVSISIESNEIKLKKIELKNNNYNDFYSAEFWWGNK